VGAGVTWRDGAGARFAGLVRGGFGRIAPRRPRTVARRLRRAVTSALHEARVVLPKIGPRGGAASARPGGWQHAARRSTGRMRLAWRVWRDVPSRAVVRVVPVTGRRVADGFAPEIRRAGGHLPAHRAPAAGARYAPVREARPSRTALRAGDPALGASRRRMAPYVSSRRFGPGAGNGGRASAASWARPVAPIVPERAVHGGSAAAAASVRPEARFAAPERIDLGRWLGGLFGDEARRPPSGVTGYDTRMSPVFPGRKPGF
ncbi:unnamed protein product, partial [Acidocella sp. C78]